MCTPDHHIGMWFFLNLKHKIALYAVVYCCALDKPYEDMVC